MIKRFYFLISVSLIVFVFFKPIKSEAQSVSCQELYNAVTENFDYRDVANPLMSTMLAKVTYYTLEGQGFVVAYIKSNEFDYRGKPYINCGISSDKWSKLKYEGMNNSWGKSFHAYIREYTCNCN
jgi:hypothetical protein